ncbi:MAG TPA: FecR domain-containing protein [Rhizomicrobium sp.]|nr:FecR domain-containing protein [Rhizomicrobium sp.]
MWRVRLAEVEAQSTLEFEAWCNDPLNAAAWARLNHIWAYLGEQAHEPELIAARQAALGHAKRVTARKTSPLWRRILVPAAAVLLLGLAGAGGYLWSQRPDDYKTVQGERRVIILADGSKISLDANSEVTVRYTKIARQLHLLQGQARFDVAHDVERPFSVVAGSQKVIATGTAFNIDMVNQKVLVTLIEGHVVVVDEDRHVAMPIFKPQWPSMVELKAGQQLAALPAVPPAIEVANIPRVTAWTNGQILFDNEELSSVVARVNRYTSTQVVIDDPRVAAMRISGVLNAGDLGGFVDIVTHYLPIRAIQNSSGEIMLQGQAKS